MPRGKKKAKEEEEEVEEEEQEQEEEEEEEEEDEAIFEDVVFAVSGKLSCTQTAFKNKVLKHGATFATSVTKKVTHLVTTQEEVDAPSEKVTKAKENDVFLVSEKFVTDSIEKGKKLKEADYAFKSDDKKPAACKRKPEAEEEKPMKKTKVEEPRSDPASTVKVRIKGRAAVDVHSGHANDCHVYEEGDDVYDCMLNQTNIKNNNNKFYVIQLLQADAGNMFYTWNRWGRVGERGQSKVMPKPNLALAKKDFEKKFKEKTRNNWADRENFRPSPGKYTLIKLDYGEDKKEEEEEEEEKEKKKEKDKDKKSPDSKLDKRVQRLIKLIFDLKMMERAMTEMEYDVKKQPLGKLTKEQIKTGYNVLKRIEEEMKRDHPRHDVLEQLSSEFYTVVPHSFGRQRPPVINSAEMLKTKIHMVEALADIQIAAKLIEQAGEGNENPVDASYKKLNTDIEPVDENSEEFEMVKKYIENTHRGGATPTIANVFRVNRAGEAERFEPSKKLGNRMLLWHGSRLTNFVGIISQGLRIAPPEAPASGYRFGKGLYFADIASLASRYCRSAGQNDFIMLLVDVALGKTADLYKDQYMESALPGTESTKALGTIEPDPKDTKTVFDECKVPFGKIVDSGFKNTSCLEHQYIVYKVAQANLKYLIHFSK